MICWVTLFLENRLPKEPIQNQKIRKELAAAFIVAAEAGEKQDQDKNITTSVVVIAITTVIAAQNTITVSTSTTEY